MPPENITSGLALRAASHPRSPAIVTGRETIDYATLQGLVASAANHLQAQGLGSGDCVALVFNDELRLAVGLLALARIGATAMPIPRSATHHQREQWTRQAGAVALLSDQPPTGMESLRRVPFDIERITSPAPSRDGDVHFDEAPAAPLLLIVGSGTTGGRKLIPVSHGQMRFRVASLNTANKLTEADRVITASHLEYSTGNHRFWGALLTGGAFVLPDRSGLDLASLRDQYRISIITMTVLHLEKLLHGLRGTGQSPLRGINVHINSSAVSDDLRRRAIETLGCRLWVAYGSNEVWLACIASPTEVLAHPGTVGKPVPGVSVQVVDSGGSPVPVGEVGLVRVKSPAMGNHYLGDEEATHLSFRDGWFYPNDLGRFTPDGHLIFCGRSDDMMIFNGVNISPLEIESCLLSHPSVAEAAAFPLRHPVHQDVPVAVVSLKENAPQVDQAALIEYCAERLGFRRPNRLAIVESLPRNPQGKLVREELRRMITANL